MSDESELQSATEPLTDRQKQVMELIARGFTNPQIAEKLGITLDGAKWHVREILTKVGAQNREEAAAWWRRERRPAQRLQRTVRTLVSVNVLRIAAGVAVVVIAGVLGTLALIALKDDEPPAATDSTATAAATAAATMDTTPTPIAPPATVGGKPVTQLAPGAPIEFPDDLVLYVAVSGCANCGFGSGDLWRIHRGNDGQLTADHAESAGPSALKAVSVDGSTIISGICGGYCGGEGFPSETAVMRFVISHDGGVTWQDVPSPLFERTEFWFGGWYKGEVVATAIKYQPSNQIESVQSYLIPSFTPLAVPPGLPAPALNAFLFPYPRVDPGGRLLWSMRDASGVNLVFDDQGNAVSRAALEDAALGAELRDGTGDPLTGLELWQSYYGPDGGSVLFLADSSGTPLAGYAANEQIAWLTGLSADSFFAATVLPLADGEQPLGGNQNFRAVLVDTASGLMHPINGLPRDASPLPGAFSWPVMAIRGSFWRVDAGDDCLNVREEGSTAAASLGCFATGVLLREREATVPDGWIAVSTPDGRPGFAAKQFLR